MIFAVVLVGIGGDLVENLTEGDGAGEGLSPVLEDGSADAAQDVQKSASRDGIRHDFLGQVMI
jgi:hypothetical protein